MVQQWASPRTNSNKSMPLIRRALRCLEALAAGHTERAAISSLPDLPATPKPQDAAISELYGLPGPPGQQLPSLGLPGQLPTAAPVQPPNIARMQQAGTLFESITLDEYGGATLRWPSLCNNVEQQGRDPITQEGPLG